MERKYMNSDMAQ